MSDEMRALARARFGWGTADVVPVTPETKARRAPRDGDGDGRIYDGTPREQPAPVRMIDIRPDPTTGHSIRDQMISHPDWRRGYQQTWDRMKDEPLAARQQAAHDLAAMQAQLSDANGSDAMLLSGALAALKDLYLGAVDPMLSTGYTKPVSKPRAKGRRPTVEYIDRPDSPHAVEVRAEGDTLTVEGRQYGTLRKDVSRPTKQEWVLTTTSGTTRTFPTKYAAMHHAGKNALLG